MAKDIVIVFWLGLIAVLALLALFQVGVARQRFHQRKFGTIAVMYGDWLLGLVVFKLTTLLGFDGPLLAANDLKGSYGLSGIPYFFKFCIIFALVVLALCVVGASILYAVVSSSSMDFWPKVWSIVLFIFYAWLVGACVVAFG